MGKSGRRKSGQEAAPRGPGESAPWGALAGWRALAVLGLAVMVFYWIPLTSEQATIQWDAVDVHYSAQKYFADRAVRGELPHWTPYVFSGFPFLADVQVGAWYPLNWPFFLTGITPRAIQAEIALHAWLACAGAFLLLARRGGHRWGALIGSLCYGFTAYFADHASHVGMFAAAAGMPWLLLCFDAALEGALLRYAALGGLVGGAIILAGHFQNALYSFAALGLYAIATAAGRVRRAAAALAMMAALAAGTSAIAVLPGLELAQQSIRAGANYAQASDGLLTPATLLGAGLPLLLLAALGLRDKRVRLAGLLLAVPTAWYMLGPDAGLYRLGWLLPGFHKVRAPVHLWFAAAFGLCLLASAGAARMAARWPKRRVLPVLAAVLFADLYYRNSLTNVNAYARHSFDELYGNKEVLARQTIVPALPPLTRYHAADKLTVFGPLNHPLDIPLETTYGYNPLELQAYAEYRGAMARNEKLRRGLGVALYLDAAAQGARRDAGALPRAYFARQILRAKDPAESLRLLETLDPAQATVVLGEAPAAVEGTAQVTEWREQSLRIRYKTPARALLRVSVPWFPGWKATVDGAACPLVRADHALTGVVAPAGEKELVLEFRSNYFIPGAATSAAFALAALLLARFGARRAAQVM